MPTKRVLIIDDEETILTVVQVGIEMIVDWQVLKAGSGAEGIQTAQAEKPDVILLDMMMPEMDGISTFKALQSHTKTEHIPVILLTAKAQTAEQQQFHELGVRGVITKPFNSLQLPAQISRILHW
ncbi:MAG: response regulator [Leptolyngbya sp. Prado105]|jgi:CheY-like chemotaxis protein|nr:response regulator [Leptolyngbya sp. Prado105]